MCSVTKQSKLLAQSISKDVTIFDDSCEGITLNFCLITTLFLI